MRMFKGRNGREASLAHELGQPLGSILINAQAGQRFMLESPPDLDELRVILEDTVPMPVARSA